MSKELKTLEEHNKGIQDYSIPKVEYNGIACPKCGEELYDSRNVILTSYPPQRNVACSKCDYTGYRLA